MPQGIAAAFTGLAPSTTQAGGTEVGWLWGAQEGNVRAGGGQQRWWCRPAPPTKTSHAHGNARCCRPEMAWAPARRQDFLEPSGACYGHRP